jgi:hypothetical protein
MYPPNMNTDTPSHQAKGVPSWAELQEEGLQEERKAMLQVEAAMLLAVELHAELHSSHGLSVWKEEAERHLSAGRTAVRQCEESEAGTGAAIEATTMPSGQSMRVLEDGTSVQSTAGAFAKETKGTAAAGAGAGAGAGAMPVHVVLLEGGEKVQIYADGAVQVTTTGVSDEWIGGQLRLAPDNKTMVAVRLRKVDKQPIQTQWTANGAIVQVQRQPAETRVQINANGSAIVLTADKVRVEIPQIAAVVHSAAEDLRKESALDPAGKRVSASDLALVVDRHEEARKLAHEAAQAVASAGVVVMYVDGTKAQVGGDEMRLKLRKTDGTILQLLHAGGDESGLEDDDDESEDSDEEQHVRRPGGRRSMYVVTKSEPGRMGMLRAEANHCLVITNTTGGIALTIGPDGKPLGEAAAEAEAAEAAGEGQAPPALGITVASGGGDPLADMLSNLMSAEVGASNGAASSEQKERKESNLQRQNAAGGKKTQNRRVNDFNSVTQLEMMLQPNLVTSVADAHSDAAGASKKEKKKVEKAMTDVRYGKVSALVRTKDWGALLAGDQLKREIAAGRTLHGFNEAPIVFAPTFKVARHEAKEVYNEKRTPSWTDRVVFKSITSRATHLTAIPGGYTSSPSLTTSDHKPVRAVFKVRLPEAPSEHLIACPGETSPCCLLTQVKIRHTLTRSRTLSSHTTLSFSLSLPIPAAQRDS